MPADNLSMPCNFDPGAAAITSAGSPVACWPRRGQMVDSSKGPNRVNRAHWPTKENRQKFRHFLIFPVHGKNGLRWPQIGLGGFFPTNPDLADVLGRTDLNFENFYIF